MVIQNSEVSMTSKTSIASSTKLTIQSEKRPLINLEGIQVIGDAGKIEKSKDSETEKTGEENTVGEGGFLSSLNYALGSDGKVKEVESDNPLLNAAANRQVRFGTMEYLIRMLLRGKFFGEDSPFGRMLQETFGITDASSYSSGLGDYSDLGGSSFIETRTLSYSYHEEQSVEFSSRGTAVTADGRKLSFNYSFAMSESFTQEFSAEYFGIKNCIDPLVINLDDCPTSISDQKFYFDLDGDGEIDELHNIKRGAGFLALDRNGDGEINDGFELFGARTGDGFEELSLFDEDGNGWIDENDSVFAKLRIMTVNEKGEKELYGLKQSDVGAIFLGRIDTDITKHDSDNNEAAAIRKSGMFLHESDGHAGGVQHVDFIT